MNLYARMAVQNIKKNHRFFIPRILTEAGLLGCFYIVYTLYSDERMSSVYGGNYLPFFMFIGISVVTLLSVILMLYTNSFLMKQRKREFGLYNVLGLEKRHVGKILFFESAISNLAGIICGILFGMLFYKLCALFICKLLNINSVLGFYYLKVSTIIPSIVGFVLIDLFTYFVNLINIARMKPVELIASASTGEKEPKVKWLMLVIGSLALAGGYYLALATKDPISALPIFFLAVILVIIGTYFLFVTGTTFVLKRLKANKNYYYNKKHMTSVSGILYRMKQNAVGLASICILSTGVLVLISTTVSLYSGMEDIFSSKYQQELYIHARYEAPKDNYKEVPNDIIKAAVEKAAGEKGLGIERIMEQTFLIADYKMKNGKLDTSSYPQTFSEAVEFILLTQDEYAVSTGQELNLKEDELAFCTIVKGDSKAFQEKVLTLAGKDYKIAKILNSFPVRSNSSVSFLTTYGIVLPDQEIINKIYKLQKEALGSKADEFTRRLAVKYADKAAACAVGFEMDKIISSEINKYVYAQKGFEEGNLLYISSDSLWDTQTWLKGMYGSFLFLGILLGLVFLFATTLIIYYKQISEGYEDRKRFQIMEKIGMSQDEVKGSIRTQILLVFFLPLLVAGLHTCFAFPLLMRLLSLLLLPKLSLFVLCTLLTFFVFAFVYVVIYSITAKTYYKIVH